MSSSNGSWRTPGDRLLGRVRAGRRRVTESDVILAVLADPEIEQELVCIQAHVDFDPARPQDATATIDLSPSISMFVSATIKALEQQGLLRTLR